MSKTSGKVSELLSGKVALVERTRVFNTLSTWRSTGNPPRCPQANSGRGITLGPFARKAPRHDETTRL